MDKIIISEYNLKLLDIYASIHRFELAHKGIRISEYCQSNSKKDQEHIKYLSSSKILK